MSIRVEHGDCLEVMPRLIAEGVRVDSVVTDPPYHLTSIVKRFGKPGSAPAKDRDGLYARASRGFMGKEWDGGDIAFRPETWRLCFDLMKPGAHLLAFSGTRTYHRMACAIEDAGFEIRDQIGWLYGSGFPKSHDVSKAIDKAAGAERDIVGDSPYASRKPNGSAGVNSVGLSAAPGAVITAPATDAARQWEGWGTALKPAWEPIVLARKPLSGTVAGNVLEHGTGALNIDGCRVHGDDAQGGKYVVKRLKPGATLEKTGGNWRQEDGAEYRGEMKPGRWPANVIHDGSPEVLAAFAAYGDRGAFAPVRGTEASRPAKNVYGEFARGEGAFHGDTGTAARFFYSAKADAADRLGSKHPTVKPVDLIAYLCRLVTPPGGLVLDPFAGSGTTGMACLREGFRALLIEREAEYVADIHKRLQHVRGADTPLFGRTEQVSMFEEAGR